eukprot:RCo013555
MASSLFLALLSAWAWLYRCEALVVLSPHLSAHDVSVALCTSSRCTAMELAVYHPTCSDYNCLLWGTSAHRVHFVKVWKKTLSLACEAHAAPEDPSPSCEPDTVTLDVIPSVFIKRWMKPLLQSFVKAQRWVHHDHHWAHASSAFYGSPFHSALAVVFDGGGTRTDTLTVFFANRSHGLTFLKSERIGPNAVIHYRYFATVVQQVDPNVEYMFPRPGLLMELSTHGKPREVWANPMQTIMRGDFTKGSCARARKMARTFSAQDTRADFAASAQLAFQSYLLDFLEPFLTTLLPQVDGIVFAGGASYNILLNTALWKRARKPVYVPPCPGDPGTTIGAAWLVEPPPRLP